MGHWRRAPGCGGVLDLDPDGVTQASFLLNKKSLSHEQKVINILLFHAAGMFVAFYNFFETWPFKKAS